MEISLHEIASSSGKVVSHDMLPNTSNPTALHSIISRGRTQKLQGTSALLQEAFLLTRIRKTAWQNKDVMMPGNGRDSLRIHFCCSNSNSPGKYFLCVSRYSVDDQILYLG